MSNKILLEQENGVLSLVLNNPAKSELHGF